MEPHIGWTQENDRNKIHLLIMNYEGNNLTIMEICYQNYFYQKFLVFFYQNNNWHIIS